MLKKWLSLFLIGASIPLLSQSPYNSQTFKPATIMTASGQTSTAFALGSCNQPNTGTSVTASVWSTGTITLIGTSLTTATFGVLGSSDCGVTYSPVAINSLGTPGTFSTTATANGDGVYQINLTGLNYIKFVTSGTFTGTNISLLLTAAPIGTVSRNTPANPGTITGVTAGTGLNGGGTSGNVTLNLNTALPDGETATTQSAGDNSTKVATDQFVNGNITPNSVTSAWVAGTYHIAPGENGIACDGMTEDTAAVQSLFNIIAPKSKLEVNCSPLISNVALPIAATGLIIDSTANAFGGTTGFIAKSGTSGDLFRIYANGVVLNNLRIDGAGSATNCLVLSNAGSSNFNEIEATGCTGDGIQVNPFATPTTTLTSNISSGTTSFTVANAALGGMPDIGKTGCSNLIIDYGTASQEEKLYVSGSGNTMTTPAVWAYTHSIGASVRCAGNDDNMTFIVPSSSYNGGWGINEYSAADGNDIRIIHPHMYGNHAGGILVANSGTFIDGGHFENNSSGPAVQLGDTNGGGTNGLNGRVAANAILTPFGDIEGNGTNGVNDVCSFGNSSYISSFTGYVPGGAGTCPAYSGGVNSTAFGPTPIASGYDLMCEQDSSGYSCLGSNSFWAYDASRTELYRFGANGIFPPSHSVGAGGPTITEPSSPGTLALVSQLYVQNLVPNGNFATPTGWYFDTGWSWSAGYAVATNVNAGASVSQNFSGIIAGRSYLLTYTVSNYGGSGSEVPYVGNTPGTYRGADGTFSEVIVASNTNGIIFSANSSYSAKITNVIVEPLISAYALATQIPVSAAVTSATGGAGTGTVTCLTARCTNLSGSYSVVGGTFTTGNMLDLVWPTTTTAYNCQVIQNGGIATYGIGHTVATATGMTITSNISILGVTVTVDYECNKP